MHGAHASHAVTPVSHTLRWPKKSTTAKPHQYASLKNRSAQHNTFGGCRNTKFVSDQRFSRYVPPKQKPKRTDARRDSIDHTSRTAWPNSKCEGSRSILKPWRIHPSSLHPPATRRFPRKRPNNDAGPKQHSTTAKRPPTPKPIREAAVRRRITHATPGGGSPPSLHPRHFGRRQPSRRINNTASSTTIWSLGIVLAEITGVGRRSPVPAKPPALTGESG